MPLFAFHVKFMMLFECMTFAPATIVPMTGLNANVEPNPDPNPNPNLYTTLNLSQMITLALTLCWQRYHWSSNCCQSKCQITSLTR